MAGECVPADEFETNTITSELDRLRGGGGGVGWGGAGEWWKKGV